MKRFLLALVLVAFSAIAVADQPVRGYFRRDGTYVQPHYRTEPNQYRHDNYSSPPVYNRSHPLGGGYSPPGSYDPYSQPRQRSRY